MTKHDKGEQMTKHDKGEQMTKHDKGEQIGQRQLSYLHSLPVAERDHPPSAPRGQPSLAAAAPAWHCFGRPAASKQPTITMPACTHACIVWLTHRRGTDNVGEDELGGQG